MWQIESMVSLAWVSPSCRATAATAKSEGLYQTALRAFGHPNQMIRARHDQCRAGMVLVRDEACEPHNNVSSLLGQSIGKLSACRIFDWPQLQHCRHGIRPDPSILGKRRMELAKHGCEATPVEEQHVAGQQTCFWQGVNASAMQVHSTASTTECKRRMLQKAGIRKAERMETGCPPQLRSSSVWAAGASGFLHELAFVCTDQYGSNTVQLLSHMT